MNRENLGMKLTQIIHFRELFIAGLVLLMHCEHIQCMEPAFFGYSVSLKRERVCVFA